MSRKDITPKETIKKIESLLKEIGLEYTILSEVNNCDLFFSIRIAIINKGTIIATNGKGMTRDLALASALAELMERLQSRNGMKFWYSTKNYPQKAFVHEYVTENILNDNIKFDLQEAVVEAINKIIDKKSELKYTIKENIGKVIKGDKESKLEKIDKEMLETQEELLNKANANLDYTDLAHKIKCIQEEKESILLEIAKGENCKSRLEELDYFLDHQ